MYNFLEKYKPAVNKYFLFLPAGLLWLFAGIMLDYKAYYWLWDYSGDNTFIYVLLGFLLSMIIHHFGFLKIVDKNIKRIIPLEGNQCAFSFISAKSYFLIIIMIILGTLMRHSSIPKYYLSIIYIGIGTALILSSIRYFRYFKKFIHQ